MLHDKMHTAIIFDSSGSSSISTLLALMMPLQVLLDNLGVAAAASHLHAHVAAPVLCKNVPARKRDDLWLAH